MLRSLYSIFGTNPHADKSALALHSISLPTSSNTSILARHYTRPSNIPSRKRSLPMFLMSIPSAPSVFTAALLMLLNPRSLSVPISTTIRWTSVQSPLHVAHPRLRRRAIVPSTASARTPLPLLLSAQLSACESSRITLDNQNLICFSCTRPHK